MRCEVVPSAKQASQRGCPAPPQVDDGALEWGSHSLDSLFAQRSNIARSANGCLEAVRLESKKSRRSLLCRLSSLIARRSKTAR